MTKGRGPTKTKPQIDHVSEVEERDDAIIGQALRWSLVAFAAIAIVGAGLVLALRPRQAPPVLQQTELSEARRRELPKVTIPQVPFVDVTQQAGIAFVHENGAAGEKLLPETMGGGCAFFDFDDDGHQDLLLINSQRWPWDERPEVEAQATMALYRNDGHGNFQDVTAGSGLDINCYGMGVAVADYDNDGRVDVFISTLGANRLFRNLGGGKFEEVTHTAGVAGDEGMWSTSCGWFDFNNDGLLDLFVCNYVQWSREYDVAQNFQLTGGGRAYGRPQNFEGTFCYLYRNEGNGKFVDVSEQAGIQIRNPLTGVPMGKSLGVTFHDFDGDGWLDIVVANDTVQNFLFRNLGDGRFEEVGMQAGVAFDPSGNVRGAMGIDVSHFRNNEAVGIAIGNFANEMTALYVTYGHGMLFTDEAVSTGLGPNTRLQLTFGVLYLDYDLDGRLDLFAANGHLEEEINRVQPSQFYEQSPQLFWNCGPEHKTEFLPVPADNCGPDFVRPLVGRGAALADIDGDGDLDLLIMAVGGPPRLLRNDQQLEHNWLRLKLIGTTCNRDAIGAMVEVRLPDRTLQRHVMPTRSYLSQVELPVTFGLGLEDQVQSVTVRWPDGSVESVEEWHLNRMNIVTQSRDSTPLL